MQFLHILFFKIMRWFYMFGEKKLRFEYRDLQLDLLFDFETIDRIQEIEKIPFYQFVAMFLSDVKETSAVALYHMVNSQIDMINEDRTDKIDFISFEMIKKIISDNENETLKNIMDTIVSCIPMTEKENGTNNNELENNDNLDRLNIAIWYRNALKIGMSEKEFRKSSLKKMYELVTAGNEDEQNEQFANIDDVIPY